MIITLDGQHHIFRPTPPIYSTKDITPDLAKYMSEVATGSKENETND